MHVLPALTDRVRKYVGRETYVRTATGPAYYVLGVLPTHVAPGRPPDDGVPRNRDGNAAAACQVSLASESTMGQASIDRHRPNELMSSHSMPLSKPGCHAAT
jgi:hypothetical protein